MSLEHNHTRVMEESVSALMDNEAEELELRRVLKASQQDEGLADTWARFNLVRSVIHQEELYPVSPALSANIMAALDAEESYSEERQRAASQTIGHLWRGAGRMAIAATVALAAYVTLQGSLLSPVSPSNMPLADTAPAPTVTVPVDETSAIAPVQFDAEAQQRLNDYIRSASIQYKQDDSGRPQFNIFEDSQLIRQVNQIEP